MRAWKTNQHVQNLKSKCINAAIEFAYYCIALTNIFILVIIFKFMNTQPDLSYLPVLVHEIRHDDLEARVWRRGSAEKGYTYTAAFQRYYREGNETKTSGSFGKQDLLVLGLMATRAFEWISFQSEQPKL